MKGELASETVNYDTKIMYQFEPKWNLLISTPQVKQQVSEAVARRFLKISETPSTGKHLRLSLLACNSVKKILQYRCFSVKFTKFLRTPFFIGKLQWLLLRFNSCFQRSPGQKPMRLSPIHTRFSWKRYLLLRKFRSIYHRCCVKEGLQLYWKKLQYYENFKNTYLVKHL